MCQTPPGGHGQKEKLGGWCYQSAFEPVTSVVIDLAVSICQSLSLTYLRTIYLSCPLHLVEMPYCPNWQGRNHAPEKSAESSLLFWPELAIVKDKTICWVFEGAVCHFNPRVKVISLCQKTHPSSFTQTSQRLLWNLSCEFGSKECVGLELLLYSWKHLEFKCIAHQLPVWETEQQCQRKYFSSGKQQFVETRVPVRFLKTRLELSVTQEWLVTQLGYWLHVQVSILSDGEESLARGFPYAACCPCCAAVLG